MSRGRAVRLLAGAVGTAAAVVAIWFLDQAAAAGLHAAEKPGTPGLVLALPLVLAVALDPAGLATGHWHAMRHERRTRDMVLGRHLPLRVVRAVAVAGTAWVLTVAPASFWVTVAVLTAILFLVGVQLSSGCSMSPADETPCAACGPRPQLRWVEVEPDPVRGRMFGQRWVWPDGAVTDTPDLPPSHDDADGGVR